MSDAPKRELRQFLAAQSSLMQKALHSAFSSFTPKELAEWPEQRDKLPALREEFERILIRIPTKWDRYCRSIKKDQHQKDLFEESGAPAGRRKGQYTEAQIGDILKESEAGLETAELCRKYGISDQTYYRWKAIYGSWKMSDAQRLRQLEQENRDLKQLVAELEKRKEGRVKRR